MHVRWVIYLQKFTYVFKHKVGHQNQVADALNRRHEPLITLTIVVTSFDILPELYPSNEDFAGKNVINKKTLETFMCRNDICSKETGCASLKHP